MVVVYNRVGTVRFPVQMGRLLIQLILITWVLNGKSNTGLFLLTAYHVVTGFMGMNSKGATLLLGQYLIGFHFVIAIVIYFHDWFEQKIKSVKE